MLLLEQDAAGDAGECFPDRRHIGMRFPVPLAEVLLIDQVTVAHHYPEAGSSRRPQQGLAEKAGEERKMLSAYTESVLSHHGLAIVSCRRNAQRFRT